MEIIFNAYKNNRGLKPLFSIQYIIDWYDGVVSGIGTLIGTNDPYLVNIVAWDFTSRMKIFSIIDITASSFEKFREVIAIPDSNPIIQLLEDYVRLYTGDVLLFKSQYLDDVEYDLIINYTIRLHPYNGIEEIANQTDEERQKWFNLFK